MGRRVFLGGGVAAMVASASAFGKHFTWHKKCVAAPFFAKLKPLLSQLPKLSALELEVVESENDDVTLALIRAAPDQYDFFYSFGGAELDVLDFDLVEAIETSKLERWPAIIDALKTSPTVRSPSGAIIMAPLDWGYYPLARRKDNDVELLPYDLLLDPANAKRLALWSHPIGFFAMAAATGFSEPFKMSSADLEKLRESFLSLKSGGAVLEPELDAIVKMWGADEVDTVLVPNDWLPRLIPDGGKAVVGDMSRTIVWIQGLTIVRGGGTDETYSLIDGLLSDRVSDALVIDLNRVPAVRAGAENEEREHRLNRLGADQPDNIFKEAVWERPISEEFSKEIRAWLNGL
jgi:hypothetical protein